MAEAHDLARAREIFVEHDGSTFYMSRDGVDAEYAHYRVSPQIEETWLAELTARKLDLLDSPGNWATAHFLWHHNDTRHLNRLTESRPLGVLWERCAYLEVFLKYIQRCSSDHSTTDLRAAVGRVIVEATAISRRVRSPGSVARVNDILDAAHHRLAALRKQE